MASSGQLPRGLFSSTTRVLLLLALAVTACRSLPSSVGMAPASPLASTPTTSASPPCLYTCIRVIDGDTIEIADSCGVRTRVRLRSINAPELDQPGGPEAKAAVEMEMLGREVLVTPYARDRYGRLVAEVATPP